MRMQDVEVTATARKGWLGGIMGRCRLPVALIGPAFVIFVSSSIGLLRRNEEYFDAGLYSAVPVFLAAASICSLGWRFIG
jgi:hypothetical protein